MTRPDYCPASQEPCQSMCCLSDVRCQIRDAGKRTAVQPNEPMACQYAIDVSMPEYRCAVKCQYEAQPLQRKPYGWVVTGCTSIFRGDFAESDAKSEAWRIGGTARAIALYELGHDAEIGPAA